MSLGLKEGTVILEPHNPAWENMAQELIQRLWMVLKNDAVDIQHMGSTAIRWICAKPIIDIAVAVRDLSVIEKHMKALEEIALRYRGELNPGRFVFDVYEPDSDICTYHVHIVHIDGLAWQRYRNLRDYLNAFPEEAKAYEALKMELAQRYAHCRVDYTKNKADFINDMQNKAAQWRKTLEK